MGATDPISHFPGLIQHRASRVALVCLLFACTAGWLVWRVVATMPTDDGLRAAWSLVFFGAELTVALLSVSYYVHLNGGMRRGPPPPPLRGGSVDVLIPTYNEDVALVRRTAVAARDMDYPCHVWICDDGRRPAMRELAIELGVGYRTRPDNAHYKAGNINAALEDAEADYLLILDCDHVPRRELLSRTIGYFADPAVALVQTPQVYYNLESFQHVLELDRGRLYHENSLFQHELQAGADAFDMAFFVGTGAVFRRSALEEIGGIATETVTEDIHTAMRLHARGYRSVFVDEALAFLMAPETPLAFVQQRLRWAQGAMQILRKEDPLTLRGLRPWQRFAYFGALAGWLSGPATLVLWAAPAVYLLFGLTPIEAPAELVVPLLAFKIALDVGTYLLLSWPQGRLLLSDCFRVMVAPLGTAALGTLLKPDGLRFKVTPKGRQAGLPGVLLWPLVALVALNLAGLGVGLHQDLPSGALGALQVGLLAFCAYFAVVGLQALVFAIDRRRSEGASTIPVSLPGSTAGAELRVVRLSREVAWASSPTPLREGGLARFDVPVPAGPPLTLTGACDPSQRADHGWLTRIALDALDDEEGDRLDAFLFEVALPGFLSTLRNGPRIHDASDPLLPGVARAGELTRLEPGLL